MIEKLKPCPFCGGEGKVRMWEHGPRSKEFNLVCDGCHVIVGSLGYVAATGDLTYKSKGDYDKIQRILTPDWNKRPTPKNPWISVGDDLPTDDNQVWMVLGCYTYVGYYDPTYKIWYIFDYSGGYKQSEDTPTHWQKIILPE